MLIGKKYIYKVVHYLVECICKMTRDKLTGASKFSVVMNARVSHQMIFPLVVTNTSIHTATTSSVMSSPPAVVLRVSHAMRCPWIGQVNERLTRLSMVISTWCHYDDTAAQELCGVEDQPSDNTSQWYVMLMD
jgi:hypothetical protein